MIQLFICQWCGYVEEKELPEECQEGVFIALAVVWKS